MSTPPTSSSNATAATAPTDTAWDRWVAIARQADPDCYHVDGSNTMTARGVLKLTSVLQAFDPKDNKSKFVRDTLDRGIKETTEDNEMVQLMYFASCRSTDDERHDSSLNVLKSHFNDLATTEFTNTDDGDLNFVIEELPKAAVKAARYAIPQITTIAGRS